MNKGFTLVEVIVVLVVVAILAGIGVPTLVGYIASSNNKAMIADCKTCVAVAHILKSEENIADMSTISLATNALSKRVTETAEVDGNITRIEFEGDTVLHLAYSHKDKSVVFCLRFATCPNSLHQDSFNFIEDINNGSGSSSGNDNSSENENSSEIVNTPDRFYLFGDPNLPVDTNGDLLSYVPGQYGETIPTGATFYYSDGYYVMRNNQYFSPNLTDEEKIDLVTDNPNHSRKINIGAPVEPGPNVQPGDVKIENGEYKVFMPYKRYPNDYLESSWWCTIRIATE